jgi:hypothetical protein
MFSSMFLSGRTYRALCLAAFLGVLAYHPLAAQNGSPAVEDAPPPPAANTHADSAGPATRSAERLREGTRLVDVPGTFATLGADRVSFSPDGGKESYRLLQNLALERISRMLEEQRGPKLWTVSGTITEYKGANFLLVTKWQSLDNETPAAQ